MLEVVRQTAGRDLVGLVDEIALGDEDHPARRANLRENLGHVVQQPHGLVELSPDHFDHLCDDGRRDLAAADRDRGLDHRQPERLDAVAEGRQVLAFRGGQRGLHRRRPPARTA